MHPADLLAYASILVALYNFIHLDMVTVIPRPYLIDYSTWESYQLRSGDTTSILFYLLVRSDRLLNAG